MHESKPLLTLLMKAQDLMKRKKTDEIILEPNNIPEYKSFYFYDYNLNNTKAFNNLGHISKNVYNLGLYSIQIFNCFKIQLYKELYDLILIDKNINCNNFIKTKLIEYFDLYSLLKNKIKQNNFYIYKYIIRYIKKKNIIIKNNNYEYYIKAFIKKLKDDDNIYLDNTNNFILLKYIIIRIIFSIYVKNYNQTKDQLTGHKSLLINDEELINNVKNQEFIDFTPKNIYKDRINGEIEKLIKNNNKEETEEKIKELLKENKLKSDQNYISRLAYAKLGNNYGKLDSTMICSILTKAYNSYSSYFALLSKGIKANRPNFLDKNSQFNLIYTYSKTIKEDTNKIKLYTSTFIANNYNKIYGDNYVYLDKNKYIDEKYLKNITGKIKKKDNYVIDNNNNRLFIEKTNKHIIDSRYISLTLPDKTIDLDIKMIEIIFINNQIKISLIYDTHLLKKTKETINIDQSISIDLGMKNLMTIYNPTGTQKIIDGKFISSINTFYNNKLAKAQSINDIVSFKKYQMKRLFIINNYFNNIVKWMEKEYSDKKLIIIGYNKEWKQNTNMGRATNLKFNKIPYMKLINKIKIK